MECEKFENLLIDELYGELDEVTSAAVKRHAAGCARCGALLSGLRATRKVAALPVEEPSSDLEDRILSAVREQQKVLPFRARMSTLLSRAGAWAMQPQTAMAAVLLLVIGTSFVLVQSRKGIAPASDMRAAEGTPVVAAPGAAASAYAFDGKEAAFAHGIEQTEQQGRARLPAASPNASAEALLDGEKRDTDKPVSNHAGPAKDKDELSANAATIAGTDDLRGGWNGDFQSRGNVAGAGGGAGHLATGQAQAQQAAPVIVTGGTFDAARQQYNQQHYEEAKNAWDSLAPSDPNAALWAARADKAKNGCTAAVIQRYEQLRQRAGNTTTGNDATLEVGRCYRSAGNTELARSRFSSLLQAQNYAPQAQSELDQMSPAVASKSMQRESAPRPVATTTSAPVSTPPTQKASGY